MYPGLPVPNTVPSVPDPMPLTVLNLFPPSSGYAVLSWHFTLVRPVSAKKRPLSLAARCSGAELLEDTGLPNVQVQDLYVQSSGIIVVTHGRGAWSLPASADVGVQKTGPASFPKGANATYTVTVTNHGPSAAASVRLSDVVPSRTTFMSESQTAGPAFSCKNPPVGATGTTSCSLSLLNSGASASFKLTYHLPSNTTLTSVTNTATVSSSTPDPVPANNSSTLTIPVS